MFHDLLTADEWQVLLAAVALLVAIVLGVWAIRVQRRTKRLEYEIISRAELLSVDREIESRVGLTFDGKPIQNVELVLLKVSSVGNQEIVPTDFQGPIGFRLTRQALIAHSIRHLAKGSTQRSAAAQILSVDIAARAPTTIEIPVTATETEIQIGPCLLNPYDTFTLKMLVSNFEDWEIEAFGRIAGVPEIRLVEETAARYSRRQAFGITLVILGQLLQVWSLIRDSPYFPVRLIPGLFALGGTILVLNGMAGSARMRRKSQRQRKESVRI